MYVALGEDHVIVNFMTVTQEQEPLNWVDQEPPRFPATGIHRYSIVDIEELTEEIDEITDDIQEITEEN